MVLNIFTQRGGGVLILPQGGKRGGQDERYVGGESLRITEWLPGLFQGRLELPLMVIAPRKGPARFPGLRIQFQGFFQRWNRFIKFTLVGQNNPKGCLRAGLLRFQLSNLQEEFLSFW